MNSRLVVAVSVVAIVLIAGAFLVSTQQGSTTSTESQSSTSTSTSVNTSGSYSTSTHNLELQLSVGASSANGNVTISMSVDEYNALAGANNVSASNDWPLQGLALGPCGNQAYPFGVALYSGVYTAGNVSEATPLPIYPIVACPMFIRLVTGYLFQPTSDMAVILPSGPNATATEMSATVNATSEYRTAVAPNGSTPLGPGTYTVAAGDEWGSITLVHFTIGSRSSVSTSAASSENLGLGLALSSVPVAATSLGGWLRPRPGERL